MATFTVTPASHVYIGGSGADTLLGSGGDDSLFGGGGADLLTGGSGADLFALTSLHGSPTSPSTLAAMAHITDFNPAEGDRLAAGGVSWTGYEFHAFPDGTDFDLFTPLSGPGAVGLPILFGGQAAPQAAPAAGLALPDPSGGEAYVFTWIPSALPADQGGWLALDLDRNGVLGGQDYVIRIDLALPGGIDAGSFLAGSFARTGTTGDDSLAGTAADDSVAAFGGGDTVLGLDGDDWLDGGTGDDSLLGGAGEDILQGQAGADTLAGGADDDWLRGGSGNDLLQGGDGDDILEGDGDIGIDPATSGDDTLQGGAGDDWLLGGPGADVLTGGAGADEFELITGDPAPPYGAPPVPIQSTLSAMDVVTDFSTAEGDKLFIDANGRSFSGATLPLVWIGGGIAPQASLAAGLVLPDAPLRSELLLGYWVPALEAGQAAGGWVVVDTDHDGLVSAADLVARVGSAAHPVTISAADFHGAVVTPDQIQLLLAGSVFGTAGADRLVGTSGSQRIFGLDGDDTLVADARQWGETLYGGAGDDTAIIDFSRLGSGWTFGVFYNSADPMGRVVLAGVEHVSITGTGHADSLTGAVGSDTVLGGAGNDTLTGGAGNDSLDGGVGRDIALLAGTRAQTILTHNADGSWTATGPNGADTLSGIELAHFDDGDRALAMPLRDFDGDGRGDILFRAADGGVALWQMNGLGFAGGGPLWNPGTAWSVAGTGDFDGDGRSDILWRHTDGSLALWRMNGTAATGGTFGQVDPAWRVAGVADMDGDGHADILWRHADGNLALWRMNGTSFLGGGGLGQVDTAWQVTATADFNGDGRADILWRSAEGGVSIWLMDGTTGLGGGSLWSPGPAWSIAGAGDFNGDGRADILWRGPDGELVEWWMDGTAYLGGGTVATATADQQVAAISDYDGDGHADILWRNDNGALALWEMNGTALVAAGTLHNPGSTWAVA